MIIGQAIKEEIGSDFTGKFLSRPMEIIKKFSRLSCMLLGTQPKMRNYYRNAFFTLAFDEEYERLKIYEDLLVNFSGMNKKDREEINERIKSFEPCQSWPLRIEFDFLHWLRTNNNIVQDKIRYRDFKDSEHDFRFEASNKEFNVELTSLGQSEPNKELEEGFYLIAEKLIDSIPYGKGLIIKVNTEMLVNKNNRMEKEYICKFLTEEIEKIRPIILIKHEGFCLIPKDLEKLKEILCDEPLRKAFSYQYEGWFERMALLQNTNDNDGREYLEKVSLPSELSIMSFSWRNNQRPIKYIILDGDFDSEDKRREFLLGRLEERISAKLVEKQLAGQMNPIIAVLFNDFVFHHYADNNYPVGNDFQRIQERILKIVKDNGNKEIKGILLIEDFEENFMRFIPNPNLEVPRDILNIIELFISRKD